ncbi:MAG: cytochrome-c peroxidase, partial [Chitinophagaceae bacterium]
MKFRIILSIFLLLSTSLLILDACKKPGENFLPPTLLQFTIPGGWPAPIRNIFANNPLTEEGFQLGKMLFYDGILSKDGGSPCSSCHQPIAGFGTFNHDLSHGYNNSHTKRNAVPLFNLAWMVEMNWDGSSPGIEDVSLRQINDIIFMGENTNDVLNKLRNRADYRMQFGKAFGSPDIDANRLSKALAQFIGSFISANSKYDKVKRGETGFTANEASGYAIYKSRCASCHSEPL